MKSKISKVPKCKWLCIYVNPEGEIYYKYGDTKSGLKQWSVSREGFHRFFKLTYKPEGTLAVRYKLESYEPRSLEDFPPYLDSDWEF